MNADAVEGQATAVPPTPTRPATLVIWAIAWSIVSALGWVVFMLNLSRVAEADFSGQRTFGIVTFTPVIALAIAGLCLVQAIRAVGRTREYRSRWSPTEREDAERARLHGQPWVPFIVFALGLALIWSAGVVAVLTFLPELSRNLDGLSLASQILALIAMLGIPALRAGLRRRRAAMETV